MGDYNLAVKYLQNKYGMSSYYWNSISDQEDKQLQLLLSQYCYGYTIRIELNNQLLKMKLK
jgi:hypothetical protein